MKYLIIALISLGLIGCATPRTKFTDKTMRVMIDADSIDEDNHVQVQQALVKSGSFTVVDRYRGFRAAKKEQELTHRTEPDRFADKEKWSHWGKLYGVGGIIIPHTICSKEPSAWNRTKTYMHCKQFLQLVDSNTGEVLVMVQGENDGRASFDLINYTPDWDETVEKFVEAYPKKFKSQDLDSKLVEYQGESDKHAKDQKAIVAKLEADRLARAAAEAKQLSKEEE